MVYRHWSPIHTTPEEFENKGQFPRSFSKTLFKLVEFENTGLSLSCPWSSFPQTQIQNDRVIFSVLLV